ncbi:hypothetical protein [uncultured Flavobacterium sp.]|uniref:hypothetical protein n=1 Tax=uncultured Flavobacterium sp. TaxID=165435 RepID=UPI0030EB157D|tara:strand:+ start:759 stop:1148 length:390 start_codon:yes stop_codon:yes gene_type:complete
MKKIIFILSGIALLLTLVSFGFYGVSKMIYNSCSCEQFNIDNIELRTGINIPSIKNTECIYDEITKTKKATFLIDTEKVDLEAYILKNKLVKSDYGELYVKSNNIKSHSYQGVLNKKIGKLNVEINFKD